MHIILYVWDKDFGVTKWSCFKHNNEEQPLWWRWEEEGRGGTTWLKTVLLEGSVSGAACLLLPPCRTVEPAALPSPHPSFNSPLYEQNLLWLFHISFFYWAFLCSFSPPKLVCDTQSTRPANKKGETKYIHILYPIKSVYSSILDYPPKLETAVRASGTVAPVRKSLETSFLRLDEWSHSQMIQTINWWSNSHIGQYFANSRL